LLDTGTAIAYGPSAAVLLNLADRKVRPAVAGTEPVLTVGDPAYPQQTPRAAPLRQGDLLAQATGRSRYSALRARLSRLPYSGLESQWVAQVFQDAGLPAMQLVAAQATEGNVRARIAERRYVHLACHGMSSSAYGNFFGALAFAPGPKTGNPADDGLLTLAEIYDLDLKGCELALVSACETNYGPQQQGEGVWALSRGFLVAGARRVVASNWVVDDKAGASLISYTCSGIAQSEKRGQPADYAAALHAAKRWVRQQDQWSSPFYWASLVFVGPN
jgi:CHAT domain-containing protein